MLPSYLSYYFLFFPRFWITFMTLVFDSPRYDFAAGSQECGPRFWLERCSGASQSNCVYVLNVGEPYIESIDTLIVDFLHKIDNYFDFLQKIKRFPFFFWGGGLKIEISHVFFYNLIIDCDGFGWRLSRCFSRPKWTWFWSELTTTWRDFDWLSRKFDTWKGQCCLLLGWMMCSIDISPAIIIICKHVLSIVKFENWLGLFGYFWLLSKKTVFVCVCVWP